MGKLIDADALIKALGITDMNCERCAWYSGMEWNPCKRGSDFEQACFEIENAPEAVVRCKDCKHRPTGDAYEHDLEFPDHKCPCQCEDYWYSWMPDDDWYCANGERKTNE